FKEQNLFIRIDTIDYINIQYRDIEHNFHNEWYELNGDELLFREPKRGDYNIFLEINTMSNEEIYDIILSILNEDDQ
ncbi:MAG: hypothetical protein K2I22_06050, partial [Lachnospiraceae bacterium]|nr:hypothetical protein [Lachnospiraceae bacterium]